jgi:hypothetical protein
MEVMSVDRVAFENRYGRISRDALDILRRYSGDAAGTAGISRREGGLTGQNGQVSDGGAARPETQDEFARRTGLAGIFIDTYA